MRASFLWLIGALLLPLVCFGQEYQIGVGIGDVTGPASQTNMMGYASIVQDTQGIHTRLFSRSYVFLDQASNKRVVFSSVDIAFVTQNVKVKVTKLLKEKFGNLYDETNVLLSATHTHSGPGGYADYVLFQITSFGFSEEAFEAIVGGIYDSIVSAHENLQPARGFLGAGDLIGANINRSPTSYLLNPLEERRNYQYDTDVRMSLLKIVSSSGKDLGLINWFPVHPVSMNNSNHLISSDNKGVASLTLEEMFNGPETLPGKGPFVASFASSNLGDVSPATRGTFCTGGRRPGLRCDAATSTCPNLAGNPTTTLCHGQGPAGKDSKENTRIIADLQAEKAWELYKTANIPLTGGIDYKHVFVNMTQVVVNVAGQQVKLCKPAMGQSFAAGTTDGPGMFLFYQGDVSGNPFWDRIRDFIKEPSEEITKCQAPKPIFFATGEMRRPFDWQADILDLQILKIGNLVIVGLPGEFTTMSGRRLRNAIRDILVKGGSIPEQSEVVLAGLSGTYADYITTYEEYQAQRYEAASTLYGPHTLSGFIQEYSRLAQAIVSNSTLPPGPTPPDFTEKQFSFIPKPEQDTLPEGAKFGSLISDVLPSYKRGSLVTASFWGANPRNNPQMGSSFLYVERKSSQGAWTVVRTDANWDTEFIWEKVSERREPFQSTSTFTWQTGENTLVGEYRLRYEGHSRDADDKITPFTGLSSSFLLTA